MKMTLYRWIREFFLPFAIDHSHVVPFALFTVKRKNEPNLPNSKATFVSVCVYNCILRVSGSTTNAITFDWKLFMYSHPAFFSSFSFILNALCTFACISTVLAFIWRPFEMVDHPSASISASLTNPYLLFNWATQSSSQPWNERATSFLRKQLPWWKHKTMTTCKRRCFLLSHSFSCRERENKKSRLSIF